MNEDTLVHVARLSQPAGSQATPDALWLDTESMRFVVIPVTNGDVEPPGTPVEDYLAAHPDRTEAVRTALAERFRDLPQLTPGGRARLLDRKMNLNADELISRITPDNVHPETGSGPPVGNEAW